MLRRCDHCLGCCRHLLCSLPKLIHRSSLAVDRHRLLRRYLSRRRVRPTAQRKCRGTGVYGLEGILRDLFHREDDSRSINVGWINAQQGRRIQNCSRPVMRPLIALSSLSSVFLKEMSHLNLLGRYPVFYRNTLHWLRDDLVPQAKTLASPRICPSGHPATQFDWHA